MQSIRTQILASREVLANRNGAFRLARIVGDISREVYTVHGGSEEARSDAALRITKDLELWRTELPPTLSTIQASSLIPIYQRQNNVLQLAYAHAIIHANRVFLLDKFVDLSSGVFCLNSKYCNERETCVAAARQIVETVNDLVEQGVNIQAFWWTHYICFCAVVVIYVDAIQKSRVIASQWSRALNRIEDKEVDHELVMQAELCQRNIAQATLNNAPSRRYRIILQELRQEVTRQQQNVPSTQTADDFDLEAGTQTGLQLSSNPNLQGSSRSELQPLYAPIRSCAVSESTFPDEGLENSSMVPFAYSWGSMGWADFDSWASSRGPCLRNF
jgi:hypothetical protein